MDTGGRQKNLDGLLDLGRPHWATGNYAFITASCVFKKVNRKIFRGIRTYGTGTKPCPPASSSAAGGCFDEQSGRRSIQSRSTEAAKPAATLLTTSRPRPTLLGSSSNGSNWRNVSMMASKLTGSQAPGGMRSAGTDSTAQASDAHDERIARFSWASRVVSVSTSCGRLKCRTGWSDRSRKRSGPRGRSRENLSKWLLPSMILRFD
ncbi:hypothetical protein SAMN03159463_05929 [Mesorhizobium sp. NFR06]|nr:hypothetical protein SAMN03159463_05929 [Mesorhizobium sp. NFR06]